MAKVETVEKVASFCLTFDRIIVSNHPDEPVKVKRGLFKKGDLILFDADVARHVYKSHFFYGKAYKPSEWAMQNPKVGDVVETMDDSEFWGLRRW